MKSSTPQKAVRSVVMTALGVLAVNTAVAADPSCIDYYTVGESKCQPVASTPVKRAPTQAYPQLIPPSSTTPQDQAVDQYLANYGKPPREFVEFYLNPTADNAQKWVDTYQGMLQKGQDLSKAWTDAERLYSNGGAGAQRAPGVPAVQPQAMQPAPEPAQFTPVAPPAAPAPLPASIGAFSAQQSTLSTQGIKAAANPVNLTYYFSQVCPYCARTTPDLAVLSKEKEGTLTFTCVDLTPVTPQSQPQPGYITAILPCKWRLPEGDELNTQAVQQTPTLLIQKAGQSPVRLSGYVPLAQLRQYF